MSVWTWAGGFACDFEGASGWDFHDGQKKGPSDQAARAQQCILGAFELTGDAHPATFFDLFAQADSSDDKTWC